MSYAESGELPRIVMNARNFALAFSEPDKAQAQIKDIIEAAYDSGAEMLVTPCPLCQANTEVYQGQINKKYGTKFNMPVLYYSQLMTLAYGGSA